MIELSRAHLEVAVIDCTYKTNRYRTPLLHIASVTPVKPFSSSAFCFVSGENEED